MKLSEKTVELVNRYVINELDMKVIDGISYVLTLNDGKHNEKIAECNELLEALRKDGVPDGAIFRKYNVSNGFVYDLDLKLAVEAIIKMASAVAERNNGQTPTGDMNIRQTSYERYKQDMESFAKEVIKRASNREMSFEVAMFSRNKVPRIVISGNAPDGRPVACQFPAFAIRHSDIEDVNRRFLAPKGLRVVKVEVCEILPSCTGVRFIIHVIKI